MMHANVLKTRKSYLEQYLSRCAIMEQKQSTLNNRRLGGTLPLPILKMPPNKPTVQAKTIPEATRSTSVAKRSDYLYDCKLDDIDQPFDLMKKIEFEEESDYQVGSVREEENCMKTDTEQGGAMCDSRNGQVTSGFGLKPKESSESHFRQMINEYANALDLNNNERQWLGFYEKHTKANPTFSFSEDDHDALFSKMDLLYKDAALKSADMSLVDKFEAHADYKNNNKNRKNDTQINHTVECDNSNQQGKDIQPSNHQESETKHPHTWELITNDIINLINNICGGDHDDGARSCFKCKYKESFKSFTLLHLEELKFIMENTDISLCQQEEAVKISLAFWIHHLSEQGISLVCDYDEALYTSDKLKEVLLQSRNTMRRLQKESAHVNALNYELAVRDRTIKTLEIKLKGMEETGQETKSDVDSLTELVVRLRDKGIWDIHGLPLGDATYKKIFRDDYYLHGAKVIGPKEFSARKREWRAETDQLKSERDTLRAIISAKDKEIHQLKSIDFGINRCRNSNC